MIASLPFGRRASRLIERNLMVYRRGWIIIFSGFFEPFFYLLGIGFGIGSLVGNVSLGAGHSVPYAVFVAPALMAGTAMNGALYDSTFNLFFKLRYAKTYDAVLATPLGVADVALGEVTWALMRGSLYSLGFLVVMAALGLVISPWALLALPAATLIGFSSAAVGTVATTFMRKWQDFDLVIVVTLPLLLFSATFFPAAGLRPAHAALPRRRPDPRTHDRQPGSGTARRRGLPGPPGRVRPGDHVASPPAPAVEIGQDRVDCRRGPPPCGPAPLGSSLPL